jgi:transposase
MEAPHLRSQGIASRDISRLCGIPKASCRRKFDAYVTGGIEQLEHLEPCRSHSTLHPHCVTIETDFRRHPPATLAEPTATIEALTGMTHNPTQVRQALNVLGMKPRRVGRHIRPPPARLRVAPG